MTTLETWQRSPNYRYIYSNSLRVRVAATDVAITFATIQEVPEADKPYHLDEASVVMSYAQAKLLAEHLTAVVKGIETALGPIKVPSSARASSEAVDHISGMLNQLGLSE